MTDDTKADVIGKFLLLPDGCRSDPATESQLQRFEAEFGSIPEHFRWFLQTCGGGTIGSRWVDDIHSLIATHRKFTSESSVPGGWDLPGVFVIGWDGAGNPFGIETTTGRLLVADHDFGGVHVLSRSLASFLLDGLSD